MASLRTSLPRDWYQLIPLDRRGTRANNFTKVVRCLFAERAKKDPRNECVSTVARRSPVTAQSWALEAINVLPETRRPPFNCCKSRSASRSTSPPPSPCMCPLVVVGVVSCPAIKLLSCRATAEHKNDRRSVETPDVFSALDSHARAP